MQVISPNDPSSEQRRYPRFMLRGGIDVTAGRWPRRRTLRAGVRDASPTGMALEVPGEPLAPGTPVKIRWQVPVALGGNASSKRAVTLQGRVVRGNSGKTGTDVTGIRLDRLISEYMTQHRERYYRRFVAILGLIVAVFLYWPGVASLRWFWYEPVLQTYTLFFGLFVLGRIFLSFLYKEPADVGSNAAPCQLSSPR